MPARQRCARERHFGSSRTSNLKEANSRGQRLRWLRIRNEAIREQNHDYYKIRATLPVNYPDKDAVISLIIEDLLTGAINREDVGPARAKA
jgi:hypothetical protein